jgi:hypothetical protein
MAAAAVAFVACSATKAEDRLLAEAVEFTGQSRDAAIEKGDRPLILQKAGGLQGVFAYTAFSPTRGVGAFVVISQFNFGAAMKMATVVNELIAQLAPR